MSEICENCVAGELILQHIVRCVVRVYGRVGWLWRMESAKPETHLYSAQGAKHLYNWVSPLRMLVHPTERQEQANIRGKGDQRTMT